MMFLALLIYGINGDNREWMPRPEFNVYSFGYWFELSACFFLFNASMLKKKIFEFYLKKSKKNYIIKQYSCHLNQNHFTWYIKRSSK